MTEEKTFSVGVQTSSPKRISVTSNVSENPITATSDTGLYYSQLAKNWAIGEGLIQNEDYSSKTWAGESKSSADLSKMYSEAASLDLNNLENKIIEYDEQLNTTITEGVETIETTKTEASEYVETTANESIAEVNQAKEQAIKDFNKASDKVNYLFVMPIGTIGFSPFPIDETKGLRRILNGQIIIQEQFTGFVKWLKENIELYPQMACTEEQWQATVTMSVYGQCGKFVIDDEAGTIRLPRITGFVQGLTDFASLGNLVEAGLPTLKTNSTGAHTHKVTTNTRWGDSQTNNGAYWCGDNGTAGSTSYSLTSTSEGAHTHTIAGTADTVQPEAIRYPYFIQVATGTEETVDVTREIELNNPFFFGYYQYFEVAPNNISWLKSQGQWNSKAVYTDYYDWILTNANNGVENFKLSTDTYDDYAWVVNTADETFRLPLKTNNLNNSVNSLSLYFYVGETTQNANLVNVGRIEETVVNKINRTGDTMTGNLTVEKNTTPVIYIKNLSQDRSVAASTDAGTQYLYLTDKNNATLGSVGIERYTNGRNTIKLQAFSKDGSTAPAVRVNAYANNTIGCDFPKCTTKATTTSSARSDLVAVITQNYVSGTSWYRVWSDGWIEQGGRSTSNNQVCSITLLRNFSNTNYTVSAVSEVGGSATNYNPCIQEISVSRFQYNTMIGKAASCRWYACGY